MASFFKCCVDEDVDEFACHVGCRVFLSETDNVGVVVFSGECCSVFVVADSSSDAMDFVSCDADADARCTDEDAVVGVLLCDVFCNFLGKVWVINGRVRVVCAVVCECDVWGGGEVCGDGCFQKEASVIRPDRESE